MGRIAQTTKVISEGGYEKVFHHTFEILPGEKLKKSYACYLSTSSGPVMGVLYLSTANLAFCSDNPLSYKVGDQTQWSYYKTGTGLKDKFQELPCQISQQLYIPFIGDVRGQGLMLGVELVTDRKEKMPTKAETVVLFEKLKDLGVLLGKGGLQGNVFGIKPPMCFTKEDAVILRDYGI
ncbi:hypothetical protein ZIOFF_003473 [Zingiber officinale]|uniref:GRAM domain-containing protein n=1 Tax=Zingiber officinale TaxID=94328 RepID=A0A8J5ITH6_ZINOF|nr:hypothetical protein ZIOFF_003473 [Zingiber officinale]